MSTRLKISALISVVVCVLSLSVWYSHGSPFWTRNSTEITVVDDITGESYTEFQDGFSMGLAPSSFSPSEMVSVGSLTGLAVAVMILVYISERRKN